jgi:hypothetical protein
MVTPNGTSTEECFVLPAMTLSHISIFLSTTHHSDRVTFTKSTFLDFLAVDFSGLFQSTLDAAAFLIAKSRSSQPLLSHNCLEVLENFVALSPP